MQLDPPAQEGEVRRRLGGLLVWSGLTLLAALALALAMVIASLALELGSEPAPPPTSPIQFSPRGGQQMAQ
jgi:Spy/CpxP family protein refolding chaperone